MTVNAAGMGTSGVYSEEFAFSVPLSEHLGYNDEFNGGDVVYLYRDYGSSSGVSPAFYISSKSSDENKVVIKCFDRMTFTEADFPYNDEDFYDRDGNEIAMDFNTVISKICSECGFAAAAINDSDLQENIPKISKTVLIGRTCREILCEFANAFCGYWCCSSRGELSILTFVPFGKNASDIGAKIIYSDRHETLRPTSHIHINGLYMSDNSKEFGTPGDSGTIRIYSKLASRDLYGSVDQRVSGTHYKGFDCRSAFIDDLPELPLAINFEGDGGLRSVNYCSAKISSSGILASAGCNKYDEGEWVYKNRTRRELDSRYKDGDLWGNTEITKKGGIKHVYVNENGDKDRHGYEALDGGVTVYEGDMIDKFPAENITPEYDADGKVKKITYFAGCVKTVLEIVWGGDNILSYTRKKYKVDSCSTAASEMLLLNTGEETLIFGDETGSD